MFSLRTISIYAAIACAAVSSAMPTLPGGTSALQALPLGSGGAGALSLVPGLSNNVAGQKSQTNVQTLPMSRAAASSSLPSACKKATDDVLAISAKLEAVINADIKIEIVVDLLNDVLEVIVGLAAEVEVLVKAGLSLDTLLTLDAKVLAVADVAAILYALISAVLTLCAKVVVKVGIDVNAVYSVVVNIALALSALLSVFFNLVAGLQAEVILCVKPLVQLIIDLKLEAILSLVLKA